MIFDVTAQVVSMKGKAWWSAFARNLKARGRLRLTMDEETEEERQGEVRVDAQLMSVTAFGVNCLWLADAVGLGGRRSWKGMVRAAPRMTYQAARVYYSAEIAEGWTRIDREARLDGDERLGVGVDSIAVTATAERVD